MHVHHKQPGFLMPEFQPPKLVTRSEGTAHKPKTAAR